MPENHHAGEHVRYLRVAILSALLAVASSWLFALFFLDDSFFSNPTGKGEATKLLDQSRP
ncbi:MAG: hypothetical protein WC291_02200 [Thermodesulfovibrionales bacterium]